MSALDEAARNVLEDIFLNLMLSALAAVQAPIIMMSQNRIARFLPCNAGLR